MAKRVNLDGRKRLLDVGGGSGAYSLAFCAANPSFPLRSLTFHKRSTQPNDMPRGGFTSPDRECRWQCDHRGLADRPRRIPHVLCLERGRKDDVAVLARRAVAALPPGGLVLVHDFMVDDAREGPPFAAWYLLGSIFDNPKAVCLTPAYVEGVLREAGLELSRQKSCFLALRC